MKSVTNLLKKTFSDWIDHDAQTMGASLSYYTMLSLAPLLVIALAVAGLVFSKETAQTAILSQLGALVGQAGTDAIQTILKNAQSPKSGIVATVLGLLTLLVGASGVFNGLRTALNRVWDVKPAGTGVWATVRAEFLSFGMVLGIGFLLLVSLVVSAVLSGLGQWLSSFLPVAIMWAVNTLISVVIITLLFALIYRVIPETDIPWSDVGVGAFVTAVLFVLGKFLIGLYLGKASVGSAYGAAGSVIVLLVWIYYSAQIFLFGAEFTHVYSLQHGSLREKGKGAGTQQPSPGVRA